VITRRKSNNLNDKPYLENQVNSSEKSDQPRHVQMPTYLERLTIEKSTKQSEFYFIKELQNVCVKIPLFQAIKYVPIYGRVVRELCLKKPG
jgi:hypothetical protein